MVSTYCTSYAFIFFMRFAREERRRLAVSVPLAGVPIPSYPAPNKVYCLHAMHEIDDLNNSNDIIIVIEADLLVL